MKPFNILMFIFFVPISRLLGQTADLNSINENEKYFEPVHYSGNIDSIFAIARNFYSSPNYPARSSNSNGNEATVATSVDGQVIFIYKNDKKNGNLFISSLNGNKWTEPERLNLNTNTPSREPNEFISADGKTLYFTSNHTGGFGGKDIYKCKKLPNGQWDKAVNLGPDINTAFDEKDPFIYPDGSTLFFNSNRYKNIKEFDVYTSSLLPDGTWLAPTNIGYPLNSIKDDNNYLVSTENTQYGSYDYKEGAYAKADNYIITFFNAQHSPLTLLRGVIMDREEKVGGVKIKVMNNETQEVFGAYRSDNKTGQYIFILPQERNINVTYKADGYLFFSSNINIMSEVNYYQKQDAIQMQPVAKGSAIILNNIFFRSDDILLSAVSEIELDNIFQLLTKDPRLVVSVSGYISSNESRRNRIKHSRERAQSIVNYLAEKGIDKERLIAKGYGVPKRKADRNDKLQEKNENYWFELKILKFKKIKNNS
jgi:outer membrane protein OmpA-like peptidoglycan-associated protein